MTLVAFDDADRAVAARLSASGYEHCRQVAETARVLAARYCVDPELAALAGLLHDWDRELSKPDLIQRAQALGIHLTEADLAKPKLLHARTAAADLREAMPELPPEVTQAIELHTLGAPKMTDLDRVVYLADMLEPGRTFPGVEELREAVGEVSLHELFVRGYAHTIRSLADRRRPLHPSTVETWNAILAEPADD